MKRHVRKCSVNFKTRGKLHDITWFLRYVYRICKFAFSNHCNAKINFILAILKTVQLWNGFTCLICLSSNNPFHVNNTALPRLRSRWQQKYSLELEVPKRHVPEQTINHFTEDSKHRGHPPPPLSPSRQPQVIYIYNWQYIAVGFPSSSKQSYLHRHTTKYA
jgi:hypothetical protein